MKPITLILIAAWFVLSSANTTQINYITGVVNDQTGNRIENVQVIVQETKVQTKTDHQGKFRIAAASNHHLIFRHTDFQEKIVAINGKLKIQVQLLANEPEQEIIVFDTEADASVNVKQKNIFIRGISKMHASYAQPQMMMEAYRIENFNTENYATIHENGFRNTSSNPLSTFSIDVDKASYSNVRRYLNMGQKPPVDAVRIEEMINYFNYDYTYPTDDKPFALNSELTTCPWNKNHQLLMVGLQAKEIEKTNLPASNLVFLLDVSGSMNAPDKLPLVKSAMRMLVNELRPNDRVAIVVYAGAAGLVLPSTSGKQKQKIMEAIDKLDAGGSTAGGEGLKLAYKTAHENFVEGANNRIILATDGDFNIGVSSTSEMERLVEKERESGIFMTVLGVGTGNIKDDKMEVIADKGNGNYAYIDNVQEARKVLVNEFGGTLFTVAKDVKLQLEFNPSHVKAYRLIGYENRLLNDEDFKDDKKDAGEMGAGHRVTALYEIIPADSDEQVPNVDELRYQKSQKNNKHTNELATIKARFKQPEGDTSIQIGKVISPKTSKFENASNNIQFAASVASFGMLLRDSEFIGNMNFDELIKIAKDAKGKDDEGYRGEFIRLVEIAKSINTDFHAKTE